MAKLGLKSNFLLILTSNFEKIIDLYQINQCLIFCPTFSIEKLADKRL